jgi:hypothetical protein
MAPQAPFTFGENAEAYCLFAKSHRMSDALALMASALEDGTWIAAPDIWTRHLAWSPFWQEMPTETRVVRSRLVQLLLSGKWETVQRAVTWLFVTERSSPLEEVPLLVSWMLGRAGPNDAPMIAEVIDILRWEDPTLARTCFPLVEWILKKGSAELRSKGRSGLASQLIPIRRRISVSARPGLP